MASHVGKTWLNVDSCYRHEQKSITCLDVQWLNSAGKEKRNMRSPKQVLPAGRTITREAWKMKIKIHYLGLVKTYTNKSQDEIELKDGASLSELLNKLATEFGTQFTKDIYESGAKDVKAMFTVMVNGIVMGQFNGVDTKLKDSDNVILMPLMTGG
jgi:MoaD family protein